MTGFDSFKLNVNLTKLWRFEFSRLTSGTTWHSAAMMNIPRGTTTEGALVKCSKELMRQVDKFMIELIKLPNDK